MGVIQKSWFRRNRFCQVTPAKFIKYLKSFYKVNLDINKPLRLWVIIKFRTLVLPSKYRRKIEFNKYKRDIVGIIKRLCKYKGVEIIEGHIMPDHIHLLLSIPPKYSVSSFMGIWKEKIHWWYLIFIKLGI